MKAKLAGAALTLLGCFVCSISCLAQDEHTWRDTNKSAIRAMRNGDYDESERLFQQAFTECKDVESKATVQENLDVLLTKEGKKQSGNVQKNDSAAGPDIRFSGSSLGSNNNGNSDAVHQTLSQIDAAIKQADEKGDLDTLQVLFQKKMVALKARDNSETLDYAYCMHFRAQVLHELHRDEEGDALDANASRLRDQLRNLQTAQIAAPQIPKTRIQDLSFRPIPPPSQRTIQPVQTSYANATPQANRRAPRGWRNFVPADGSNTSGYLNGNPNPPPGSW